MIQQRLANYLTTKIKLSAIACLNAHSRIEHVRHYLARFITSYDLMEPRNSFEELIEDLDVSVLTIGDNRKPEHFIKCVMCCGVITTLIISIDFDTDTENKICNWMNET